VARFAVSIWPGSTSASHQYRSLSSDAAQGCGAAELGYDLPRMQRIDEQVRRSSEGHGGEDLAGEELGDGSVGDFDGTMGCGAEHTRFEYLGAAGSQIGQ
jgi:hypothetical protein